MFKTSVEQRSFGEGGAALKSWSESLDDRANDAAYSLIVSLVMWYIYSWNGV